MGSRKSVTSELQKFIQQRYEDTSLVIYRQQHSGSLSRLRITSHDLLATNSQNNRVENQTERQKYSKLTHITAGVEFFDGKGRDKNLPRVKRFAENEDEQDGSVATVTQSQVCILL